MGIDEFMLRMGNKQRRAIGCFADIVTGNYGITGINQMPDQILPNKSACSGYQCFHK